MPERPRLPPAAAAGLAAARALAAALGLPAGCSLSYEEARVSEQMAPEIPDTVMVGFTHTVVDEGRVWVRLSARRAEGYDQSKRIVPTGGCTTATARTRKWPAAS